MMLQLRILPSIVNSARHLGAAFFTLALLYALPAQAQVLQNGSFENPPLTTGSIPVSTPAFIDPPTNTWRVATGNIQIGTTPAGATCQSPGGHCIMLNRTNNGRIEQTMANPAPGRTCTVRFWMSREVNAVGPARLNTFVNGTATSPNVFTHSIPGMTPTNGQWQVHSFTFTTTGASSVLAFQAVNPTTSMRNPAIDNVSMECSGGPVGPETPTPNPCCPPWDGDKARGIFSLMPGSNLNQPNQLQFNSTAAHNGQLMAYANLVSWTLYNAPNMVRVNIDFRLFSAGAVGAGTSGTSPVLGGLLSGPNTRTWTSTTGPLPAGPAFFTNGLAPNTWFIIRTRIHLTHAQTGQPITYFGESCSNVDFPFNVMTRAALAGTTETDARSRELVLVTSTPEGRLMEVPIRRLAPGRN